MIGFIQRRANFQTIGGFSVPTLQYRRRTERHDGSLRRLDNHSERRPTGRLHVNGGRVLIKPWGQSLQNRAFQKMTYIASRFMIRRCRWEKKKKKKKKNQRNKPKKRDGPVFLTGDSLWSSSLALSVLHQWLIHFVQRLIDWLLDASVPNDLDTRSFGTTHRSRTALVFLSFLSPAARQASEFFWL